MPSFIPAPPTKEFFIPATGGTEAIGVDSHPGYLIDHDLDLARIEFMVPHDFHNLVYAELVWIARETVTNMSMNIYANYGGHGEEFITHYAEGTITRTTTMDLIYRDTISAVLTQLSRLDHVGIRVTRPSAGNTKALILGIRIRYT